jgi:hypothetical protein
MNQNEFQKGLKDIQKVHLSEAEKSAMLRQILATSTVSPYTKYLRVYVPVCLMFILIFGSVSYAAQGSLPGEKLYTLKTRVVEPLIGTLHTLPEEKVAWEEEKVSRRITEAEQLATQNKLDESKTLELEEKIEKSSRAFAKAAEQSASSTATSTKGHEEKVEKLKQTFREKFDNNKEGNSERFKAAAERGLESNGSRKEKAK